MVTMVELIAKIRNSQQQLLDTIQQLIALPDELLQYYVEDVAEFKHMVKTYRNGLVSTLSTIDQLAKYTQDVHKEVIDGKHKR